MRKILFVITLFFVMASIAVAETVVKVAGVGSGEFFNINATAVSAAMGGTGSLSIENPTVLDLNPSGLSRLKNREMCYTYTQYLDELSFNAFHFATPFVRKFSFGLSVKRFAFSDYLLDERGYGKDKFDFEDLEFQLGSSYRFTRKIFGGVSVKYLSEKIHRLSGRGFSLGFGVTINHSNLLTFGISGQNLFGEICYGTYSETLTSNIRFSSLMKLDLINISFDVNNYYLSGADLSPEVAFGVEFMPAVPLFLRCGLRSYLVDVTTAKISYGFGFKIQKFSADYAAELMPLGETHRLSVSVKF